MADQSNRHLSTVQPGHKSSVPTPSVAVHRSPPLVSPSSPQEHSCEICGAAGLSDDVMREHTRSCHVEGCAQCPFCGLSGVEPAELLLHVNQAHLDYLTPENELMSFIDDQTPSVDGDSDSTSDCNGYSPPSHGATSQAVTMPKHKMNGGSTPGTNGKATQNNGHSTNGVTPKITTHKPPTQIGKAQQKMITNYFPKKFDSAEQHSNNGSTTSNASARAMTNGIGHHPRSASQDSTPNTYCDNINGAAGGPVAQYDNQSDGKHGSSMRYAKSFAASDKFTNGSTSNASAANRVTTNGIGHHPRASSQDATPNAYCDNINGAAGPVANSSSTQQSDGKQGSPLRSQLGLNLKTHAPATTKPSPLQCPLCAYLSDSSSVLEEHINRAHFDPLSPSINNGSYSASASAAPPNGHSATTHTNHSATAIGIGATHSNAHHSDTLTALACPICCRAFVSANDLELHVNIEHRDILSPATADMSNAASNASSTTANGGGANGGGGGGRNCCPVCNTSLDHMHTQEMELHIEGHFAKSPQLASTKAETELEKQAQKLREQREFEMLRAQYGMDDQGNFREQSADGMQRAVYAGEMSVADYYERQVGLRAAESHGIDDGTSCTRSVAPRVASLSAASPNVMRSLVCSAVDHYASSYGDKGWGCGYRNLQMMLSSLLQNTTYNEALYSAWGNQGPSRTAMPSISRLQKMVEAAWAQGFDVQGSEQLGCKLHNTRKWIGATEVVTVLSWLRINCTLVDFHRPNAADGRHPELFNWVLRYFEEPRVHSPPLYLQHQGHSRTIIGIEQRANGPQLLILDPSHGPRQVAALGSSQDSLRLIRRGSAAMRAPQYQIVAIKGLIETEDQYQSSKVLRSLRVPPEC